MRVTSTSRFPGGSSPQNVSSHMRLPFVHRLSLPLGERYCVALSIPHIACSQLPSDECCDPAPHQMSTQSRVGRVPRPGDPRTTLCCAVPILQVRKPGLKKNNHPCPEAQSVSAPNMLFPTTPRLSREEGVCSPQLLEQARPRDFHWWRQVQTSARLFKLPHLKPPPPCGPSFPCAGGRPGGGEQSVRYSTSDQPPGGGRGPEGGRQRAGTDTLGGPLSHPHGDTPAVALPPAQCPGSSS